MRKMFRLAAAAVVAVATAAPLASAQESVGLAYRFFLGGVLIGKANFSAELGQDAYQSQIWLETDGVVGWFFEADVTTRVNGALGAAAPLPSAFNMEAVYNGEPQTLTIAYQGDTPADVNAAPPFDPRPWQLEPSTQDGTIDPVSAIIAVLRPADGDVCNRTLPIYDGRRRYDVVFEGEVSSEAEGDVTIVECAARWTRVAGFKPNQLRKPDYDFRVRFAVRPNGVAVPIRAWGETDFGAAMAVLREQ